MAKKPTLSVEFENFKDKFNVEVHYNRLTRRIKSVVSKDGVILLEETNKANKEMIELLSKSEQIESLGLPEKSSYVKKILVMFKDGTSQEVDMLGFFNYFEVAKRNYEINSKQ